MVGGGSYLEGLSARPLDLLLDPGLDQSRLLRRRLGLGRRLLLVELLGRQKVRGHLKGTRRGRMGGMERVRE